MTIREPRGHAKKCYDFLALGERGPKGSKRRGRARRLRPVCARAGESVRARRTAENESGECPLAISPDFPCAKCAAPDA